MTHTHQRQPLMKNNKKRSLSLPLSVAPPRPTDDVLFVAYAAHAQYDNAAREEHERCDDGAAAARAAHG